MELYRIEVPAGHEIKQIDSTHWALVKIENYLPKTWEEFCKMHPVGESEVALDYYADICKGRVSRRRDPRFDRTSLPDGKTGEAMRALCQLIQLRNFYNGDWEPDWTSSNIDKYVILNQWGEIKILELMATSHVLSFKSKELATEFLENFRDLIEIAKPLL